MQRVKQEEQQLLENIREAYGAKHVVRVCSMYESEKVLDGARRLLEHAELIRQSVDLRGASLAIDDCYEVWGSGFISIPYDFNLSDLQPQLMRLLSAGKEPAPGGSGGATTSNGSANGHANGAAAAAQAPASASGSPVAACLRAPAPRPASSPHLRQGRVPRQGLQRPLPLGRVLHTQRLRPRARAAVRAGAPLLRLL